MPLALDPIAASDAIVSTYRRYLGSLLPLRDDDLIRQIDAQLEQEGAISRGPLLEVTPPFTSGKSLRELTEEGLLSPHFPRLFSRAFPGDRPLYVHQEQSIRKALAGRNLVIATGTGSGKTESFLVPLLDGLVRELAAGELGPGVRALLLYPMNALANDQLKRLREVLRQMPEITFGRYTGETQDDPGRARERFRRQHGREPLQNEVVSRQEMQAAPPHILLTNYAMLEYLLLRPRDLALFQGPFGGHWRHVIVDEAHVYDGIKGAEIAMLLRRLHERVGGGSTVQCLASSATVGDDGAKVAAFGRGLFGAPFEWIGDDPIRQDVVRATRRALTDTPTWGPLTPAELRRLAESDEPSEWLRERDLGTLEDERSMHALQRRLADGPLSLRDLSQFLFPECAAIEAQRAVVDLVDAGHRVRGRSGSPVLSARYHLFASAVEGAFACFGSSGPHVRFSRHVACPECTAPMFELAACKRCGQLHLPGHVDRSGGRERLVPSVKEGRGTHWLVVGDHVVPTDEDDDAHEGESVEEDPLAATLCTSCAVLGGADASTCAACGSTGLRRVQRLDAPRDLTSCRACGGRSPRQIRRFSSGSDATAAVLATSLYEHVPIDPAVSFPGRGRRLLLFSDSRQQAAYAAPYLQNTYGALLQRTLIARAIEREGGEVLSTSDVATAARREAERAELFSDRTTAFSRRTEVATWLQREMIEGDERNSLEGTALVRVSLRRPRSQPPAPLLRLGLSAVEAWDLLDQLVQTLRIQGAVAPVDDNVDLTAEVLAPRNRAVYARGLQSDSKQSVLSWVPSTRGRPNRRHDYLERVLVALGCAEDTWDLLKSIWTFISDTKNGPGWLVATEDPRRGPVWRVDADSLEWRWTQDGQPIWRCTLCRRPAARSVRGVCPTNGCGGTLRKTLAVRDARDHYAETYRSMTASPLRAEEHTAQLTAEVASELQEEFINGEVNVLSCSTTFELGVDVGELQTVMLRNVPPTTANYVQRAGRAGRRTESAALVLTFAQMRSHDQSMFQRPDTMIKGTVRAPVVVDDNSRVDRRHAHSVALAAFFRDAFDRTGQEFRTVKDFYAGDTASGDGMLRGFLTPPPESVDRALREVLPPSVQGEVGLDDGSWVERLLDLVDLAGEEYRRDVSYFQERLDEVVASKRFNMAQTLQRVIGTLDRQQLFAYLARRNVLPKYGFPVDTVELRVLGDVDSGAAALDLSRDLTVAINEYAPGGAIVARGKIIESAGVYRFPQRELIRRQYAVCPVCEHLEVSNGELDSACPCGASREGGRRSFVKPEFGFVASRVVRPVGTSRPPSRWLSRQYLLDEGEVTEKDASDTSLGPVRWRLGVRARMCVLNEGVNNSRYLICDWCGAGISGHLIGARIAKSHVAPLTGRECSGHMSSLALAHDYETDVLILEIPALQGAEQARSVLYGLLAGAGDALEISRDDIDGTVLPAQNNAIVLFDTVPAGAGLVRRIASGLPLVVRAMADRVGTCDCGLETSCYRCLRVYRNQAFHEELRREHVIRALAH